MAFTNKDILAIQNGHLVPNDDINTMDLFRIMALKHAGWLYDTEPSTPFEEELAIQYRNKIFHVANQVIDNNQQVIHGLYIQTLIAIGNTEATIAHLENKSSDTWSNYLGDSLEAAFEKQAKITNAERVAYVTEKQSM